VHRLACYQSHRNILLTGCFSTFANNRACDRFRFVSSSPALRDSPRQVGATRQVNRMLLPAPASPARPRLRDFQKNCC